MVVTKIGLCTVAHPPIRVLLLNSGKYVFPQLVQFINRYELNKCFDRYNGDYHVRDLNCCNQFLQLFFGQLTARNSLRDISVCLKARKKKLYHFSQAHLYNFETIMPLSF